MTRFKYGVSSDHKFDEWFTSGSKVRGASLSIYLPKRMRAYIKIRPHSLGDSGFCIFRSSNLLYYQPPQTHYFNCPRYAPLNKIYGNYFLYPPSSPPPLGKCPRSPSTPGIMVGHYVTILGTPISIKQDCGTVIL